MRHLLFPLMLAGGIAVHMMGCSSDEDPAAAGAAGSSAGAGSSGAGGNGATGGKGGSSGAAGSAKGGGGGTSGAGDGSGNNGGESGSTGGVGGSPAAGDGGAPQGGEPGSGGAVANGGSSGSGGAVAGSAGSGGAPDTSPVTIAVIGSSTAEGKNLDVEMYGGTPGGLSNSWVNRYAAFLETERPGSQVVNFGVSGYGTWEGLPTGSSNSVGAPVPDASHNITAALALSPDAVIVNYPSGDVMDGWTVDQVIANLLTIEAAAEAVGVPIWIATSQPAGGATSTELADLEDQRDRTLTEFGERAIDFWTPLAGSDGQSRPEVTLTDTARHPNAEGHRLLFEQVVAKDIPGSL